MKVQVRDEDLPDLPPHVELGGNEIEGILVRAMRTFELADDPKPPLKQILTDVFSEMRPSPHGRKLEYMDLIAVKECTDSRFLPPHYQQMSSDEVESRINQLRPYV